MGLTGFLVAAQPSWHEGQWYSLDRPAVCDDKHGPQRVQVSAQTTGVNPSASSGQALGHEARSLTIWRFFASVLKSYKLVTLVNGALPAGLIFVLAIAEL